MRPIVKNVLLAAIVLTPVIGVFLVGSFFLQTQLDDLPVSEMFSKHNVKQSLVFDVPVILVAVTLGVTTIWIRRKK